MTNTTTPKFSAHVLDAMEETGTDWRADMAALASGKVTRESLLEFCQNGVETDDDLALWEEYVSTLVAAA